jgi:glycine/D-amino acid oxidase-like deaminating enzyme
MHLQLDTTPFQTVPPAVDGNGKYQPVSYWQTTVDLTPGAPLAEDVECDLAIIGGGYSGLSIAREYKRIDPSRSVVLLEHGVVGHGASGRNGGFAMPLLGWDLLQTTKDIGESQAKRAYEFTYRAVAELKRTVAEEDIGCDLEATGYLLVNTCSARERRAREELYFAHEMGFEHRWLEGAALEEYIKCRHFRSGVFDPYPCVLNPAKLARGLKSVAERAGVVIYEQTPMLEMTAGDPVVIRTPGGTVRARQVALCMNGYGAAAGFMKPNIVPAHTYIVLTEPLSQTQLESIGWAKHRTSIETARNFIHYFRLTADNRIAFGGEDVELYPEGGYRNNDERIEKALRRRFYAYFPTLRDVKFTHAWGGVLGVTMDMFPTFGVSGEHNNIFHAAGYSGHGVSISNYCGKVLAPVMLRAAGRRDIDPPEDMPFFWNRTPMALPGDPWRYWGMQAYRFALKAQDIILRA